VFDHRVEGIHGGPTGLCAGLPKNVEGSDDRAPIQRRHAVGHAFVVETLVGQLQAGTFKPRSTPKVGFELRALLKPS
jgi:hypothetical protein